MKIVVIASLASSLVNFRGKLLAAMVRAGHDVVACAPDDDAPTAQALAAIGVRYRQIAMQRTDRNPFGDLRTLAGLIALMRRERPGVVLAYTQKPIIYGGLASRVLHVPFYAMVSGLGYVFSPGGGRSRALLRRAVSILYRAGIARARTVFVFNADDQAEMLRWRILRHDHRVVQVAGSGIDTQRFAAQPVPDGPVTFLLVARLLRDKGLVEYAEAARQLRAAYPSARFQLLGPLDPNPTGVTLEQLTQWNAPGGVEYLGETRDVAPFLARASVFVLPTYYREGLPRTILEALATGRAIITTDAPGCRETVEPGRNGFLVPVRDADALAAAMGEFLRRPELVASMGQRSRELAEGRFDVDKVNAVLMHAMALDARFSAPPTPVRNRVLAVT